MARASFNSREPIIFRWFDRTKIADVTLEEVISPGQQYGGQFGAQVGPNGVKSTFITLPLPGLDGIPVGTPIDEVELEVNPKQAVFSQAREVQKTRTNSRGRYVVQDWGPDLMRVAMSLQTGNLLPYRSQKVQSTSPPTTTVGSDTGPAVSRGIIPGTEFRGPTETDILEGYTNAVGQFITGLKDMAVLTKKGSGGIFTSAARYGAVKQLDYRGQQIANTFDTKGFLRDQPISYTDLISLSNRFRTLIRLALMYDEFDANNHILFMTYGKSIFRGYLENFSFTVDADHPWNWQFTLDFIIQQGLETLTGGQFQAVVGDSLKWLREYEALSPGLSVPGTPFDAGQLDATGVVPRQFSVVDGKSSAVPRPFGVSLVRGPFYDPEIVDIRTVKFTDTFFDILGNVGASAESLLF